MKTARKWFEEIEDEEVRKNAIKNTSESNLKTKFNTLHAAIGCSFLWTTTEQGHDYWDQIFEQALTEDNNAEV